jgi:hypothetical protein
LAFVVFYLVKYYGGFLYFISHAIKNRLKNMATLACTHKDIKFLKTQIAGRHSDQPKLSDKEIRNVSIITSLNVQKDGIDDFGTVQFAAGMGQTLTHFYSIN